MQQWNEWRNEWLIKKIMSPVVDDASNEVTQDATVVSEDVPKPGGDAAKDVPW